MSRSGDIATVDGVAELKVAGVENILGEIDYHAFLVFKLINIVNLVNLALNNTGCKVVGDYNCKVNCELLYAVVASDNRYGNACFLGYLTCGDDEFT